jgi:hypothetical protein
MNTKTKSAVMRIGKLAGKTSAPSELTVVLLHQERTADDRAQSHEVVSNRLDNPTSVAIYIQDLALLIEHQLFLGNEVQGLTELLENPRKQLFSLRPMEHYNN